ncbi:MAG TPA: DUF2520 domain-containing protein, partial [Fermentimonas sp.]|nr:DUF2520 domain-containing protein [Fermentimonas sp.]
QKLAKRVGAEAVNEIYDLKRNADLYIYSLSDDIIPHILNQMPVTTGIWVHTAGSVSIEIFNSDNPSKISDPYTEVVPATSINVRTETTFKIKKYGVIYPLQTFSKNRRLDFSKVPLFIEGNSIETEDFLTEIAQTISDDVKVIKSDKRKYLHLSAVFANNFSNHMYTLSHEILKKVGVPFDILKPLIAETAAKVMEIEPLDAQTGPAVRLDEKILNKQLELIDDKEVREIYRHISKSINRFAK